eukprot:gnl/Dysnectes_brevis/8000_a13929_279.p1 GENE.gnl/Dysnectes_brevis/8000_a13929_279~~gnl/Dysnectes_brevis/8000_a13929_279.p1  ORF type:complete len:824 (-),score=78.09 gnl/Dysnectes_brevis/8000_a13929_279:128-2248(-)
MYNATPTPMSSAAEKMAASPACASFIGQDSETVRRFLRIPFSSTDGTDDIARYSGIGNNKLAQFVSFPAATYSQMRLDMESTPLIIPALSFGFTRHCHASLHPSARSLDHPYLMDSVCPAGYYCPYADHGTYPEPCPQGMLCPGRTAWPFDPASLVYSRNDEIQVPLYTADFVSLITDFLSVHLMSDLFLVACLVITPILAVGVGLLCLKCPIGKMILKFMSLNRRSHISRKELDPVLNGNGKNTKRLPMHGTIASAFVGLTLYVFLIIGIVLGAYIIMYHTNDYTTSENPSNLITTVTTPIETELADIDHTMLRKLSGSGLVLNVTVSGVIPRVFFQILSACVNQDGTECFQDLDYCKGKAASTSFTEADPCGMLVISREDIDYSSDFPEVEMVSSYQIDLTNKIIDSPFEFRLHFEDINNSEFDYSLNSVKIEVYSNRGPIDSLTPSDKTIYSVGPTLTSPWPDRLCAELDLDSASDNSNATAIADSIRDLIPDITVTVPDQATATSVDPDSISILSGTQLISIRRSATIWDHLDGSESKGFDRLFGDPVHRYGASYSYSLVDQVTNYLKLAEPQFGSMEFYGIEMEKVGVEVDVTIEDIGVVTKAVSEPVITLAGIVVGAALLFTAFKGILATVSNVLDVIVKVFVNPRRAKFQNPDKKKTVLLTETRTSPSSFDHDGGDQTAAVTSVGLTADEQAAHSSLAI